jgi:flagellar basal-body rod protein FlgG
MSVSTLKVAASSMNNIQSGIDVVSNNIANVNTVGYKEGRANFQSLLGKAGGQYAFSGTAISSITPDLRQGPLKPTGVFTHLALKGNGFFTVQIPSGEVAYTRSGNFTLDSLGNMVDVNGNYVLSLGGGRIVMPNDIQSAEINGAGEIMIKRVGEDGFEFFDQIQLANFNNPQSLQMLDGNLYKESMASGPVQFSTAGEIGSATSGTQVVSGSLESSNVNLGTALVDLIALQRSYQAVSKVVNTTNDLLDTTLNLV